MKKLIVYLILIAVCFIPQNCKSQVEWSHTLQTQPYWMRCNVEEGNDTLKSFVTYVTELSCTVHNGDSSILINNYDGLNYSTKRLMVGVVCSDTNIWKDAGNESGIDRIKNDSEFVVVTPPIWDDAVFEDSTNIIISFAFVDYGDDNPIASVVVGTPVTGYGFTDGTIVLENLVDRLVLSLPYQGEDSVYVLKGISREGTVSYGIDTVVGYNFKIPQFGEISKIWITCGNVDTVGLDSIEIAFFSSAPTEFDGLPFDISAEDMSHFYDNYMLDKTFNSTLASSVSSKNGDIIYLDKNIQYWCVLINKRSGGNSFPIDTKIHF